MGYIGQKPAAGENNSFKILDDISSYTLTFSPASVVSTGNDALTYNDHRFVQGQRVTYTNGGGSDIGGLSNNTAYYVINNDKNSIKLATTSSRAAGGTAINLTSTGAGTSHTLTVAFDGTNTKFVASYDDGTKVNMSRSAQLTLSMNGVIQRPHDTATPANGYGYDIGSIIVFSSAPTSSDVFFGNIVANNFASFDISDNKVDNFTGDGSTTAFTLSKAAVNNENLLVTIDGVVQYPDDNQNVRAYKVTGTNSATITFASAPANGAVIQVRHIGFAGAATGGVTGFYGRTGAVTLLDTDPVVGIQSAGTVIGSTKTLNFIGAGNTVTVNGNKIDISIAGGGGGAGAFTTSVTGVQTASAIVGVGTATTDDTDLQGVGNTARGLYISNGMIIVDNEINGNHYIGTNFNGLMAGPVTVNGVLSVDGNYVVV